MKNEKEKEFITNREACRLTGLVGSTLRKWAKTGKIHTYRTATGQILYNTKCLRELTGSYVPIEEKQKIIYARVSSKKQLPDLTRQVDLLRARYPNYTLITDCASGINFKRKGLQTVLEYALQGHLSELVVAHKDRLSRFAFDLIKWIINTKGGQVTVLDEEANKSTEQELADDLLSIIHIFTCRQMGKRRYTTKDIKTKIKDIVKTETDFTGLDEHDEICLQQNSTSDT